MKSSFSRNRTKASAFTLLELLIVIAIIGILAGLMMPALSGAIARARRAKTLNEVNNIVTAFQMYYREYGVWPNNIAASGDLNDAVRAILDGSDIENNRRKLPFMEFPKDEFLDHWGEPYQYAIDHDYNNNVNTPHDGDIQRNVVAWSKGPDRISGNDDDITSWK